MPDLTPEEKRYKAARADGSFKGGFNDFLNQLTEKDKFMIAKDRAELADKGIFIGGTSSGGMPSSGTSMVSAQGGGQKVTGDAKYMPSNMPVYQPDPSLTNAQNRELQAKFAQENMKNVKNAKDAFGSIKAVSEILRTNDPSSGLAENIITGTREIFGGGGKQSQADAKLKVLGQKLVQQVPRFEGPQGVLDVTLYQKSAGDLGNPNLPIATRLGAIEEMIELQKKYYPQGDWDSISTKTKADTKTEAARSAGKVSVGAPQYATNPTTGERIVSTDGGINWKPAGKK
jgi:hypothetical protein